MVDNLTAYPRKVRTNSGQVVTLDVERWRYRDGLHTVSIQFAALRELLSAELIEAYQAVLTWYVQHVSPGYLVATHQAFCHLAQVAANHTKPVIKLTGSDVLNLKATVSATPLSKACSLLRRWARMRHPGVFEAATFLTTFRHKGGPKGVAVLTMDARIGPFTEIEWGAIQEAIDEAYVDGHIDEGCYCLAWLFLALGQRPVQHAAMKVCDVKRDQQDDGSFRYTLMVPRAKQKLRKPRSEFKERPLIEGIGEPLYRYAKRIESSFEGKLMDPSQAPLFPAEVSLLQAPGFEFHRTNSSLGALLVKTFDKLHIPSERTREKLNVSAIRFRRTVGTRAAQEGHGELVIAELLDHSDTQNVGVYVAAVPAIADRIDRAVALQLAPLAQAFKGMVVSNEVDAVRGDDPSSRILDLRIDRSGGVMGTCGQFAVCNFAAPIACYTCKSFQPWRDGPHEAVLTFLLERRERLVINDQRMAAIHDRTILAIAQVMTICRGERET